MKEEGDKEIAFIKKVAGAFPRHPMQVNRLLEADGEIIDMRGQTLSYLVAKTDGIGEEIKEGLYNDPYLIGWMAVTVTMSDLAATGADPIGLLLSLLVPNQLEDSWVLAFQKGINEACEAYGTYILGGDTNFGEQISITTTAFGCCNKPLLRKSITAGDLLYSTAPLGLGNSFAYSIFFDDSLRINYKPVARLEESKIIRDYATACIDTSDGLFPALSVLTEINRIGINFSKPFQEILSTATNVAYQKAGIPAWMFLAGPHGEYELLFSIPSSRQKAFEKAWINAGYNPLLLGKATEGRMVRFVSEDANIICEPAEIANLFGEAGGNIQQYFGLLMQKHRQWTSTKSAPLC